MGNLKSIPLCHNAFSNCLGSESLLQDLREATDNISSNVSELTASVVQLSERSFTRVQYAQFKGFTPVKNPVIKTIEETLLRDCMPGTTYVLYSGSQIGKTVAASFIMENMPEPECQDNNPLPVNKRMGLYLRARSGSLAESLQAQLSTRASASDIVISLVTALGVHATIMNKPPSFLFLDEVNRVNAEVEDIVEEIFQGVSEEGNMICLIFTSKLETANALIALNGGKIRPFPGFCQKGWDPRDKEKKIPVWEGYEFKWSREDLKQSLEARFNNSNVGRFFTEDFPCDGMTIGECVKQIKKIGRGFGCSCWAYLRLGGGSVPGRQG